MNFSTLLWGAVRVHSGVANQASKYDCSNPLIFRDMAFLSFFFLVFSFSKNLDIKKLTELEFLNLVVGCCQGTARGYKSGVPVWLLKSFWFSRNCVFYDFFHFDQKTDIKKPKFKFSTLSWGAARVHSVVANLES